MIGVSGERPLSKRIMAQLCIEFMLDSGARSTLNHFVIKALNPHYELPAKALSLCAEFGLVGKDGKALPEMSAAVLEHMQPARRTAKAPKNDI